MSNHCIYIFLTSSVIKYKNCEGYWGACLLESSRCRVLLPLDLNVSKEAEIVPLLFGTNLAVLQVHDDVGQDFDVPIVPDVVRLRHVHDGVRETLSISIKEFGPSWIVGPTRMSPPNLMSSSIFKATIAGTLSCVEKSPAAGL
jgi:hypothetical protein